MEFFTFSSLPSNSPNDAPQHLVDILPKKLLIERHDLIWTLYLDDFILNDTQTSEFEDKIGEKRNFSEFIEYISAINQVSFLTALATNDKETIESPEQFKPSRNYNNSYVLIKLNDSTEWIVQSNIPNVFFDIVKNIIFKSS